MLIRVQVFVAQLTSKHDSREYTMGVFVNEADAYSELEKNRSVTMQDSMGDPINRVTVHWLDIKI